MPIRIVKLHYRCNGDRPEGVWSVEFSDGAIRDISKKRWEGLRNFFEGRQVVDTRAMQGYGIYRQVIEILPA